MFWTVLSSAPGRNKNFPLKLSDRPYVQPPTQRVPTVKRLTTDLCVILRLRMAGAISLFPPRRLHDVLRENFTFYCSQHAKYF